MQPKRNRTIVLIIRRFFAVFILITTVLGIISSIEENSFTDETIGSAFVSLLIVYYLARSPRNRQSTDEDTDRTNNNNPEEDVDMEELLEEFEENLKEIESQEVQTNYKSERVNKHNPVKDKQSFISRIFQGRTDRY